MVAEYSEKIGLCLKSITPICKCDYLNRSIISNDSINLLEVDLFALESLVATLFINMGYEVIETTKSNDGGIDCELYSNHPIMGGKVITSNFSAQYERFASENNISLINASLLVDYFNQYGISQDIYRR